MYTHNQHIQVTPRFDSNQNPDEYRIVYLVYKYDNKKENHRDRPMPMFQMLPGPPVVGFAGNSVPTIAADTDPNSGDRELFQH